LLRETRLTAKLTHGMTANGNFPPEYRAWSQAKMRCHTPSHPAYRYYGGRGLAMCERWRDSFECFYADMGARPSARHSLDRIDNDGDYAPSNCRWADRRTQANNRRNCHYPEYNGERLPLTEVAQRAGVKRRSLYHHYVTLGLSIEESIARSGR
jgi:hypothetical protein